MAGYSQGSEPACWEMLDDSLLHSCRVWDLRARRYRHPETEKEGEFYYIDSRDWVVVVAKTVCGEIVLVRQFRCGTDELSWELPGGIIDRDEDPVQAGLRELQEETGYAAKNGRLIGRCRPNPAIMNNFCHVVLAEEVYLHPDGTDWDEHEEIESCALPESTVMQWAKDCQLGHALALNGLFFYQLDQGSLPYER